MAVINHFGARRGDAFGSLQWTSFVEEWIPRARMLTPYPGAFSGAGVDSAFSAANEVQGRSESQQAQGTAAASPPIDPGVDLGPVGFVLFDLPLRQTAGFGLGGGASFASYVMVLTPDLGPGLVYDAGSHKILEGGARDPQFGIGDSDTLVLSGNVGPGTVLNQALRGLETIFFDGGDHDLTTTDDHVAAGDRLWVNGIGLGDGETLVFDGSAERDGSFEFNGSRGSDSFRGGGGADLIWGGEGGDLLFGGGGADRFVYGRAGESTGAGRDSLLDFDFASDRLDLPVAVTGFNAAIKSGALSAATFDANLAAALGAGVFKAGKAVWFTPNSGDQAGKAFLVVDANGQDGYQAGEDFVFAVSGVDGNALPITTDFFV